MYDAFGPRRMFWGTDWTRLPCPWRQALTLFTEDLPWLAPAEGTLTRRGPAAKATGPGGRNDRVSAGQMTPSRFRV